MLPENKHHTEKPIEPLPLPQKVIIPLQQHIGSQCAATVKKGDHVLTGQIIGNSDDFVSATVHATVSGDVSAIITTVSPAMGHLITAIVIESDGKDEWVKLDVPTDPKATPVEEILDLLKDAGVVGMGGATFPTRVKLLPPKGKNIDTIILNGCECEPFITADHRLMLEYGEQMLYGLRVMDKILQPDNVYIAIEDNKLDAIEYMEELVAKTPFASEFKVISLSSIYPTGAEKTLITRVTGRKVPIGGLPMDVGVLVHNVATAKAIADVVFEGKPLIERIVTVTGAVKNPKNLLVRVGTPIRELIEFCGGITDNANEVILGGPMMGVSQTDLDFPVTKGTSCILVKESAHIHEQDCISCGKCIEVCPMNLMPTMFAKYSKAGLYDNCTEYYIGNCFECGSCTYVCPANIPLVQHIKVAKKEINMRRAKN
jgi:electron transport complex protein RnfC